MRNVLFRYRSCFGIGIFLLAWAGSPIRVHANPTGGTITQGAATINGLGTAQVTINQSSANAFINWSGFNLVPGEATTFVQPSSSSVTWNYINDPAASSINGAINANGYVILQNPNGINVGGQATITAHGLIMTTASTPALNLSIGGPWSFNAPPPLKQIINYGQINITGGGSAFLIASDIENDGTISAPGGKIGFYAGQTVLVSTSPDGRGLSAQVTLPQGSVDNKGNLIADGGSIVAQAQFVNQSGLVQANSAQNVNGTIELVASSAVNLGAGSVISANGDPAATSASPGGFVVLNAGNGTFNDAAGSTISVSGIAGGQNGVIEIFGNGVTAGTIQSAIGDYLAYLVNPGDVYLSSRPTSPNSQPTGTDPDSLNPQLWANFSVSDLSAYSQIDLQALDNITLSSSWNLGSQTVPATPAARSTLSLSAGNNITLNGSLNAGDNWNVNLTAGTAFVPTSGQPTPIPNHDGIYLNGSASLQAINGDLTLDAANEVMVSSGAIRTVGGGNIAVSAQYGNVNSGTSASGFSYLTVAPWYSPASSLGGISTMAGGDVSINAGNDVISFPTTTVAAGDPGTGAFGPKPGNVTINAGGSVYGNYVVMNGSGIINAGKNIGIGRSPNNLSAPEQNVALSLAKGSWNLHAQGDIYLQEVRNPNGVFDNKRFISGKVTPGNHLFDYDPQAAVTLTAGNGVYLTGYNLPRPNDGVPMLLPPIVMINAAQGGVTLETPTATDGAQPNDITLSDSDITLFPSAYGNLAITTTDGGWMSSGNWMTSTDPAHNTFATSTDASLLMSDSGQTHWFNSSSGTQPFSETDHNPNPAEMNNPDPAMLNISGSMQNVILQMSKFAQINVTGDLIETTFFGENLRSDQVTTITVGGQIFNSGSFNFVTLTEALPTLPTVDFQPLGALPQGISSGSWYLPLAAAIDPNNNLLTESFIGVSQAQLTADINNARLFTDISLIGQHLVYDPNTKTLTAIGSLVGTDFLTALQTPTLTVIRYGPNGRPLLDLNQTLSNGQPNPNYGHLMTDTITWTPVNSANYGDITKLNTESQGATPLESNRGGLIAGGTGTFNVTASSISLGNSDGILSVGSGFIQGRDYSFLGSAITSGATINVIAGYLDMPSSVIAALGGGDVNVTCTGEIPDSPLNHNGVGVSMDLGSQELSPFLAAIMHNNGGIALGIYTTGGGDVNVTALGSINVDTSRIGSFNGGNIVVESYTGDVDAGSGGSTFLIPITVFSPGAPDFGEQVYANGIVAETLRNPSAIPHGATSPGNITISTPQGDINANQGGIKQEALNGTTPTSPTVTLTAGTPEVAGDYLNQAGPPIFVGNIDLGTVGVIGETVIAQATGTIKGLAVSKHNTSITSQSVSSLTVLAGGTANVTAQNSGSGSGITIIGGAGVNANGIGAGATLLGQNVSVNGGAGTSTMGTTAAATAASQSAAGQASTEAQQQVASDDSGNDDENKKKKTGLSRSVGRVTVVLPRAS
jgi:filamentous hemagglutinin family protein